MSNLHLVNCNKEIEQNLAAEDNFTVENYDSYKTTSFLTPEEKKKLAEENINLVYFAANAFRSSVLPIEDIKNVAFVGYEKALTCYDPKKGSKFSTFAYMCMKNEINCFLRKEKKHLESTISFETPAATDKNGNVQTIADTLPSVCRTPGELAELNEYKDVLKEIIKNDLNRTEQLIITARYGFNTSCMTQSEIAVMTGMSQANVSKKEKSIVDKIRKILIGKYNIHTEDIKAV